MSGSGSQLPTPLLVASTLSALLATAISVVGIRTHLRNYRMPLLQRFTVRILVMVPVYALASLISLFSLDAAYWIDVGRDLYEAFVIYCFFNLLVEYLGGERQLIISLLGRQPTPHMFPVTLFRDSMDVSDPYSFLFLKRGILQYAWVKPLLAILTLVLKLTGKYEDGVIAWNTGYTYVQLLYNASICTALYCLAMFWMTVHSDLQGFRPVPKFLSVKGILFATFWQGLLVSFLVAVGAIRRLGPYTDAEHVSLALGDILICFEMPFFAVLHLLAFSSSDYIPKTAYLSSRLPLAVAFRDSFSMKDVFIDSVQTLKGDGFDYRAFEPVAANRIHQGRAINTRLGAGLRYAGGGAQKYWVDGSAADSGNVGAGGGASVGSTAGARSMNYNTISTSAPATQNRGSGRVGVVDDLTACEFNDVTNEEDKLYIESRRLPYGDYNYPNIDVSREEETRIRRDIENQVLANKSSAASRLLSPNSSRIDLARRAGVRTRKSLSNMRSGGGEEEHGSADEDDEQQALVHGQEDIPQRNPFSYDSNDNDNNNDNDDVNKIGNTDDALASTPTSSTRTPQQNDFSYSYREPNPWD